MEELAGLHPHIVHFPIALLITYSFVELFGIIFKKDFASKSAYLVLCVGIFFAFLAALTGNQALEIHNDWNEINIPVVENHQLYANLTIWYFSALLILRTVLIIRKKFNGAWKYIFLILLPVGVYFVFRTGNYGGELMHKFGVGTEINSDKLKIHD